MIAASKPGMMRDGVSEFLIDRASMRKFTLLDAMILVAATAAGLALLRDGNRDANRINRVPASVPTLPSPA